MKVLAGLGDHDIFILPANAANTQAGYFITAQRSETPDHRHRAMHLQRVPAGSLSQSRSCQREIFFLKIHGCPEEFGPELLVNDSWLRPDQVPHSTRSAKHLLHIEAERDPSPLLTITKKPAQRAEICHPGCWAQGLPQTIDREDPGMLRVRPLAHLACNDCSYELCCQFDRPLPRSGNLRVCAVEPAAHVAQVVVVPCRVLQRAELAPSLAPGQPFLRDTGQIAGCDETF